MRRLLASVNRLSQCAHAYGFTPRCACVCVRRWCAAENCRPHRLQSQRRGGAPAWQRACAASSAALSHRAPHRAHEKKSSGRVATPGGDETTTRSAHARSTLRACRNVKIIVKFHRHENRLLDRIEQCFILPVIVSNFIILFSEQPVE